MKNYSDILSTVGLFQGIGDGDLSSMLNCLDAKTADYRRGKIILMTGDKPEYVGVVLRGAVQVLKEDYDGNRRIMAALSPGDFFAEALCCAGVEESPVTVIADSDCTVMRLNFPRVLHTCPSSCAFHLKVIENMLGILAQKNLFLQNRMEVMQAKSIREKVMKYLESFTQKQGISITIPLKREEMADYLSVDRSALSHELMKMKKDGLIDYNKNAFELLWLG